MNNSNIISNLFDTILHNIIWLVSNNPNTLSDYPPDEEIQRDGKVYLRRWYLVRDYGKQNVYLHQFIGDDNDIALHDHPWPYCSLILKGQYKEFTVNGFSIKKEGDVTFRQPEEFHRVELINNEPCWTLFITGPKTKDWGFLCKDGLKHWQDFEKDGGC